MPTMRQPAAETFSPTRKQPIDDAAYWLDRAEEIQALAEDMKDPAARILLLDVAKTYKKMADRAYERAQASNGTSL
jgi:hypothetical protein